MARTKKVGPARGLGPRYGATVRKRYVKIVTELKKPHRCPSCGFVRVKRESVGVWKCRKCDYKFTGGAYTPATKLGAVAKRAAKGAPIEEIIKATSEAEEAEEKSE
ncbi:MAG: 50S ribosomal protein L37ae [Candidatus Bathyarchaeota archaeon]|nr:50S ribosomal protein L37ae [Candidatus Bathyarchaeota archaeon]